MDDPEIPPFSVIEPLIPKLFSIIPAMMIPASLPSLLSHLKNHIVPRHFYYSILSIAINHIAPTPSPLDSGSKYASAAKRILHSDLIALDYKNPTCIAYYVWSSCILSAYYWGSLDKSNFVSVSPHHGIHWSKINDFLPPIFLKKTLELSCTVVRISRMYRLDISMKSRYQGPITGDAEFHRRIFWAWYIASRCCYIFCCDYPHVSDQDIAVDIPSDDYGFRYGRSEAPRASNHAFLIHIVRILGAVLCFTNRRYLSSPTSINSRIETASLIKLIRAVDMAIEQTSSKFPLSLFDNPNDDGNNGAGIGADGRDFQVIGHLAHILIHSAKLLLYQSELCRCPGRPSLHPGRIRTAKRKVLASAHSQRHFFFWCAANAPSCYWQYSLSPSKIHAYIVFLNAQFFVSSANCDFLLGQGHALSRYSTNSQYLHDLIARILALKQQVFLKYPLQSSADCSTTINSSKWTKTTLDEMKKYSITGCDLYPWIVPKYSGFFKFPCCLASNYTAIDVIEYLNITEHN
ncbi:hypothetical protein AYI68_g5628 [Smittium mucronatum]|uniref:Transcription factor domain-containing protein n=1 Tax=Smittium mucronatum TaxID=133383 RepID=A0A1R0GTR8_9FUNG|nr:hypothetical protein AYI68_g5628 [Smittium mucronatum]